MRAAKHWGKGWGGALQKDTKKFYGDLEIEEIYKSWWDLVTQMLLVKTH